MLGLYADENFPLPVVEELRHLGFDVVTMYEDDRANQSLTDEEVFTVARDKGRALLTVNRQDFIQLHRREPNHSGLIVCTFDADFVGQAQRIADAYETDRSSISRL